MISVVLGFVAGLALGALGFWLAGGGIPGAVVAVVVAAGGYIGVSTLTEPERKLGSMIASALPNGQKAVAAVDAANAMLARIQFTTRQLADVGVRREADDFIAATHELVAYVTKNPAAYATLQHYVNVYGDQTARLLDSYAEVEASGAHDQITVARRETVEALQVLEQAAAGELSRAVKAKTLGIAADSEAIQRLARMDGYDVDAAADGPAGPTPDERPWKLPSPEESAAPALATAPAPVTDPVSPWRAPATSSAAPWHAPATTPGAAAKTSQPVSSIMSPMPSAASQTDPTPAAASAEPAPAAPEPAPETASAAPAMPPVSNAPNASEGVQQR